MKEEFVRKLKNLNGDRRYYFMNNKLRGNGNVDVADWNLERLNLRSKSNRRRFKLVADFMAEAKIHIFFKKGKLKSKK